MRARLFVALLGVAGCSSLLGIEELEGPGAGTPDAAFFDAPGPAVDCQAQRVVHLVGGTGGLAWFTLQWPSPSVITSFQPAFAYDDPAKAKDLTVDPLHPLFARRIGPRVVWEGTGADPQPTVFVAGNNETHTNSPQSIVASNPANLFAAAAALQSSLAPQIPVLAFSRVDSFGTAPGAPAVAVVADLEGAIGIFPGMAGELRPTSQQLARYGITPATPTSMVAVASQLAFTANAFRFGLIGMVIMPAFNDDPHGAFAAAGTATQRSTELAAALDAFYTDLAASSELSCGRGGNFLPLSNNVVMVVTGDTTKNPFDNAGWGDATPGNGNLLVMRSNGFTRPGWFGSFTPPNIRTNFNPNTGAADGTLAAISTSATFASVLYAITRGNRTAVNSVTNAPFEGVIGQPKP